MYILSSIADSSFPPIRVVRGIFRRARGTIANSYGLRLLKLWPYETLQLYGDLDTVYHTASEYLRGETIHHLSSGDRVILDLGAHYGLVSVKLASHSPTCDVIAIEAHPANYGVLKKNIALNHLENVKALNMAVADFTGVSELRVYDKISTHYSLEDRFQESDIALEVPCYKLSDILGLLHLTRVDLVKMDVEGLELKVLRSSLPQLAERIEKMDIEVHRISDLEEIIRLLESSGYEVKIKRAGILSGAYRTFAEKRQPAKMASAR